MAFFHSRFSGSSWPDRAVTADLSIFHERAECFAEVAAAIDGKSHAR